MSSTDPDSHRLPALPKLGKQQVVDEFTARIWPARRWWIGPRGWRIQLAHVCSGWAEHGQVPLLAGAPWHRTQEDGVDTILETARWIHARTGCPVCAEEGLDFSHLPLAVAINGAPYRVHVDERPDEQPGGRRG